METFTTHELIKMNIPNQSVPYKKRVFPVGVILVLFILFYSGCSSEHQPEECDEFLRTNARQDENLFSGFDLDKQLIIYRCGLDDHPPSDYSYEIAKRGKGIVPTLLRELDNPKYTNRYDAEKNTYAIVRLFERLSEKGELNGNPTVIKALDDKVAEIRTPWLRKGSEKSLKEIKKNTSSE